MCLYRRMSLGEEAATGEPLTAWAITGTRVAHQWAPAILSECPLGPPQASISDPLWPRLSQKPLLARL